MNAIQLGFKCCGCTGPKDYKNVSLIQTCHSTNDNNYYQIGCFDAISNYAKTRKPALVSIPILKILFQFFYISIFYFMHFLLIKKETIYQNL
jgi:hypothetical protein